MSIRDELRNELKDAMRSKDQNRLDVIRQIETEVSFAKSSPNFDREIDDNLYIEVIKSYSKKMSKAIEEFKSHERDGVEEMVNKLQFEIDYLRKYLPKSLDEKEIEEIVSNYIAETKENNCGKIVGYVMKNFKDKNPNGSLVNKVVKQILNERK